MTTTHNTLDADMVEMLRTSLRHVLGEQSDQPLATRLAELGWDEVVADDPSTALRTMFEIKGETISSADALGPELTRWLAEETGDAGLSTTTIALPSPYGGSTASHDALSVEAMTLSAPADRLVVFVGDRLAVCPSAGLTVRPVGGMDPDLGAVRVTGQGRAESWIDGDVVERLVAHGRWLVACELVGISRHVVANVVEYTKERVQYGKPIGVFQALQHRLASAHSMVVGAAHLAAEAGSGDPWTALVAKCMAGQTAEFSCTQAQQAYGAIGFTWEHEFHRYLRRTYALDRLFGDWRSAEHEIGVRLQQTGVVPRISSL